LPRCCTCILADTDVLRASLVAVQQENARLRDLREDDKESTAADIDNIRRLMAERDALKAENEATRYRLDAVVRRVHFALAGECPACPGWREACDPMMCDCLSPAQDCTAEQTVELLVDAVAALRARVGQGEQVAWDLMACPKCGGARMNRDWFCKDAFHSALAADAARGGKDNV
jgi:hypothetical protein